MQIAFKIASLCALLLLIARTGHCSVDLQYCRGGYPGGRCLGISASSSASSCLPFDIGSLGDVDTVVGFTSGIRYVLYTGGACTGSASIVYGPGINPLRNPFLYNVRSVSVQVPALPAFKSLGCFTDTAGGRSLVALSDVTSTLTIESCQAFCSTNGYNYAGVEYGRECYCDFSVRPPGALTGSKSCDVPCSGNVNQTCGGVNHINVFWNGKPSPTNPTSIGGGAFAYRGCYTDNVNNTRSLPAHYEIKGGATPETCASICKANNYTIVGLEYGLECWCGSVLSGVSTKIIDDNCRIACKANPVNWCGDFSRLNIWSTNLV